MSENPNNTNFSLRKRINRIRNRFYARITEFKLVKTCLLLEIPGYLGLLLLGYIIAFFYGGTGSNPGEFYIWSNFISDLGGIHFTPAPYLYDIAAILGGGLMIPFSFYLEKLLVPLPQKPEEYNITTRLRYRIGSHAFLLSIIGNLGYIGIGIFSIDRDVMSLHLITGAMAFGGYAGAGWFFGLIILLYDTKIPKLLGLYGMVGPLTFIIATGAIFLLAPVLLPLFEWLVLFSILVWIILLAYVIISNEELHV